MSEVKWIKITTNMFEDEKIDFIESLPEADAILVIWIKLIIQAGKCNANGFIFLTEQIPYTEEMLAHKFRRPLNVVRLALKALKDLQMIEMGDTGCLKVANWEKHQNIEGLDKIREQTRKRVAKYRKKQAELPPSNVTCNATVTEGNETDIDIDIDKDIDKELELDKDIIIMSDDESKFIKLLSKIDKYPLDRKKDLEMYMTLGERYPELDLLEALEAWNIYKLDKPLTEKSNARSQINTSFKNYQKWGKCLKKEGEKIGSNGDNNTKADTEADRLKRIAIRDGLINEDGSPVNPIGDIDF